MKEANPGMGELFKEIPAIHSLDLHQGGQKNYKSRSNETAKANFGGNDTDARHIVANVFIHLQLLSHLISHLACLFFHNQPASNRKKN